MASSLTLLLQAWALGMRAFGEYSAICKQLQLKMMACGLHDEGHCLEGPLVGLLSLFRLAFPL